MAKAYYLYLNAIWHNLGISKDDQQADNAVGKKKADSHLRLPASLSVVTSERHSRISTATTKTISSQKLTCIILQRQLLYMAPIEGSMQIVKG